MKAHLDKLVAGVDLSEPEASDLLTSMTDPDLDPVQAAAALVALRVKGECADEVRAFALGLRALATRPETPTDAAAVDIVGTGGDGSGSLNLSTGAALLAAAAGTPIIKHGNRSVSSSSGSADVLESLGMQVPLDPKAAGELFGRSGFTFLFAPAYHPAMKAIAPVRRSLGMRTVFNIAGPLANPASPPFHVLGAYSLEMARIMADTLAGMPIERAFVVHGALGWDEPTPIGPYHLFDVTRGKVAESLEDPLELGISRCSAADLAGGDPDHNAQQIRAALSGEGGPHRDALVLGASLGARVTGAGATEAMDAMSAAIDDGRAAALLDQLNGANV